ncbi:MAG: acyltransferase family protein, partial [Ilumatobacteraceae bacterium]
APLVGIVWGGDAAYWATPARLAEILLGAWLAVALSQRQLGSGWARTAPLALAALVVGAAVLPADGGLMYRGGLPLVGAASALLIAGLQVPGTARRVLAVRPLVAVGRISYGVYLYHWPIYVILDEARTDLTGPSLLALRVAATGVAATLSYVLIERPIRRSQWRPVPTLAGALAVTSAVAVTAAVLPVAIADDYWRVEPGDLAAMAATTSSTSSTSSAPVARPVGAPPSTPPGGSQPAATTTTHSPTATTTTATATTPGATVPTTTVPAGPVRVLVVGDSTAESLGVGLAGWAAANPALAEVRLAVSPGCGFVRGGAVESDEEVPFGERCDEILERVVPDTLDEFRPEVVMLLSTSRDLLDRRWSDDEGTIDPFDARYQHRLDRDYARISELVTDAGATALFVRGPLVDPYWLGRETMFNDPERRAIVDDVMEQLAASADGSVGVLDLRAWVESNGIAASHDARPDGVHWAPAAALDLAQRWLGPTLLSIARPTA